ncbi:Restriction enzyme BgcI subunit beta [Chlamydia trachomatis]|nr:Restriction enzyme BgcI subunit beta [Chlamydia trachomatis]
MAKIDTSRWSKFKVMDIFETVSTGKKVQVPTGCWIAVNKLEEGSTPRITVSGIDNGVSGFYSDVDDDSYRVYENFISISFLGTVFYHSGRASLDMKVHCLKPINYRLNKNTACFLITILRQAVGSIEYSDQISSTVVPNLEIRLPGTPSGEPDWAYMDSFMEEVMKESEACLKNLRLADEKKTAVDVSGWKEFEIGKLFPKIKKPPVLHNRQVIEDENGIPYVVRTKFDNGIKCRVQRSDEMKSSPAGVISFGAENATFFYQHEEFVSGRDIYYIDTQDLSDGACMFLTACLQPIARKYSYNYGLFPDLLKSEQIKLPVDSHGCPDWAYMDSYMRVFMQDAESSIEMLSKSLV